VFCWASKSDLLLESAHEENLGFQRALEDTTIMLRTHEWPKWGFKGSKDFLVALGSNFLPDHTFNGFFFRRFGLSKMEQISSKAIREPNDISEINLDARLVNTTHEPHENPFDFAPCSSTSSEMPTDLANPQKNFKFWKLGWEHAVAAGGGLVMVNNENKPTKQRHGVRKGLLDQWSAEKARRKRKLKACWSCWIIKASVRDF